MEAQLQEVSRRVGHPEPCTWASQGGAFWWQEALCCSTCIVPQGRILPGSLDYTYRFPTGSFLPMLCSLVL